MMKHSKGFSVKTLACGVSSHRPKSPLFEAIKQCAWMDIRTFLDQGIWETDRFDDSTCPPHIQAQKEMSYFDSYSQERIRQLPLHAALAHLAPLAIVRDLVHLYPEAVRMADSNGNLPLHIAFMTNAKDASSFLLKFFPEALMVTNLEGDLPIECYHHVYRTVTAKEKSPIETAEIRDQEELRLLEQQVTKDEYRIAAAQKELEDLKASFQQIRSDAGRPQRLRYLPLTKEEYRTGNVEL